jgi:uncharacterized protein YegJ (DUF2314 family)
MLKIVPARIFGALLTAAVVVTALPTVGTAYEESTEGSIDVGEQEIAPPNSSDEAAGESGSDRPPVTMQSPNSSPSRSASPAKPVESDAASKSSARKAAERALFGESDKDKNKPNPLLDVRGPDYYDRRAKELLRSDGDNGAVELHPLMEAHPDSFVVVCTAGCAAGRGATIVSMMPRPAVTQSPATSPDALNGGNVVSCVAGCGADGYTSMAGTPSGYGSAGTATVGEWMTTVAKVPAGAEAPAPKPTGSGDWMNKINQDRAAQQKASPPAAAPVPNSTPAQAVAPAPKPAAPAAVAAAKTVVPVEAKPSAVAEVKPSAPVTEAKPVAVTAAKPAAPMVESKPTPVAEAKTAPAPAPSETVVAKPAPVAGKPAPAVAATPAAPVADKPAAVVDAKPAKVETKPAAQAEIKPVTPAPTQMAALEAAKPEIKAPAATNQAKPAAGSGSLFQDSAKVSASTPVTAPAAKPVLAPSAAETKPATASKSLFQDQPKVAAVAPPVVEKPAAAVPAKAKDGVISVLSQDKDMNAAIEKARGSLAAFWKSYGAPAGGETDHALKVAVPGNGTTEHFWLTRIKRDNGKISGVISNQPQSVTSVKVGQRYEFTEDMISDWTFKRNGKLVGNETMRVLLPRMPEEQAAVYRKMYESP